MTSKPRLGPLPVEPLSDAAWMRVERGIWSQLDAGSARSATPAEPRRRSWRLALAVAAVAIAAVVVMLRPPPIGNVIESPRVVSGAAASSASFGDIQVDLDAHTALVMTEDRGQPTIVLETGAAWFQVGPRGQRPPFVVRAGDTTVRVVGTRFRVAHASERRTVEVEHGVVEVVFRGARIPVLAHQRWSSEAPEQATRVATAPVEPLADPTANAVVPLETAAAPPHTGVAPARNAAVPRPRAAATPDEPAADGSKRARAEYDRLVSLEAASPDVALAGYLALARGATAWADPALFAAARLAVDRGDPRAERLLEAYLRRFPQGANATDAQQLLDRARDRK